MISYILIGALLTIAALFAFVKIQQMMQLWEAEKEFEQNPDAVFTIASKRASPSGGIKAFYKYVKANLRYPLKAKDAGVEGCVFVRFIVEKDGSLSDIYVVKGIGAGCDEEAIRLVESYDSAWTPAQISGQPARQKLVLPIFFKLEGND